LLDAIASYQRTEPFQVWILTVTEKDGRRSAILTMQEDSGTPNLVTQEFDYTDFPLENIMFYVEPGCHGSEHHYTGCMVLMLPSER